MSCALVSLVTAAIPLPATAAAASGRARPPRRRVPPATSWTVDRVRLEPIAPDGSIRLEGIGEFRGAIELGRSPGGLAVVNDVAVEDYVKGIAEVPPSWPVEALRAQAVAARTYALAEVVSDAPSLARGLGADICATESCQVYAGLAKERQAGASAWLGAVDSTRGQVLLFAGRPIVAKYSSSNGGRTVAGGRPYLKAVDDPDDARSPYHRWRVAFSYSQLASAFGLSAVPASVRREGEAIVFRGARGASGGPASPPPSPSPPGSGGSPPEKKGSGKPSTPPSDQPPPEDDDPGAGGPMPPGPRPPAPPPTPDPPPGTPLAPPAPSRADVTGSHPALGRGESHGASPRPAGTAGGPGGGATAPAPAPAPADQPDELRISVGEFRTRLNATVPAPAGVSRPVPSVIFTLRPDDAGGVLVLEGRAFGHGIGMSQFGALGKALRGLKAPAILAAYYGGIRPTVPPPDQVISRLRVLLDSGRPSFSVSSPGLFRVLDGAGYPIVTVAAGGWQMTAGTRNGVRVIAPQGQGGKPGGQVLGVDPADPVSGTALSVRFRLDTPAMVSILFPALPGEEPVPAQVISPPRAAGAGEGSLPLAAAPAPGSPVPVLLLDAGGGRHTELLLPFGDAFAPAGPLLEPLPAESAPPRPEPPRPADPPTRRNPAESAEASATRAGWPPPAALIAFSAVAVLAWRKRRHRPRPS